ncbi:MAG: hypothetical protein ACYDDF_03580 [Thermoplasmatota archaeon]
MRTLVVAFGLMMAVTAVVALTGTANAYTNLNSGLSSGGSCGGDVDHSCSQCTSYYTENGTQHCTETRDCLVWVDQECHDVY